MNLGQDTPSQCYFFHFGLIVTGQGEKSHLPKLFRTLAETGICHFEVIGFTGQRSPITSKKRRLKMVGSGQTIPTKDGDQIGLTARKYLFKPCSYVILVDDLEQARRTEVQQIYERYRMALDTMLNEAQRKRVAVHFLANMLEAYYFADAEAVNQVLALGSPLTDYADDVEAIGHPKGELKKLYPGFREVDDGSQILSILNLEKVLSNPATCPYLRTLFAWCVQGLRPSPNFPLQIDQKYCLADGLMSEITRGQIDMLTGIYA